MPELPEVETIRGDLERRLTGKRFTGAEVLWPGSVDRPPADAFAQAIVGRRIEGVGRRGKFLILRLDDGSSLVVHLRMTGRLRTHPRDAERHRHVRVVLHLDDDTDLHFEDQRKFGRLYLVAGEAELASVLAKVGREPLEEAFTREAFRDLLAHRHAMLKPLLLDQRMLAGMGNIYVDEALYRAKLHPLRRSDTLTPDEVDRLYDGIVAALQQGIANRGTTLTDYRDAWGTAGRNQEQLLVFRQEGKPCPRCGTPIQKIRVAGRGTHLCPTCQRVP
jgi:formamidopyrimidine-DNA glycosylase